MTTVALETLTAFPEDVRVRPEEGWENTGLSNTVASYFSEVGKIPMLTRQQEFVVGIDALRQTYPLGGREVREIAVAIAVRV